MEPTCNTTVWNSFSSELGMSWSLEAESLIFYPPFMRLVCWIAKSSSPGITKPRQFEDPTNKHFTLVLPSVFSFEWRVSGESIQGGPNSCTSSSWGICSGSGIASGLDRLWKLSALSATAAGLEQSRIVISNIHWLSAISSVAFAIDMYFVCIDIHPWILSETIKIKLTK